MIDFEHDDIARLRRRLEKIWEQRDTFEQRELIKHEHDVDDDIPAHIYYCTKCKKEYSMNRAFKVSEIDWIRDSIFRYWRTKHKQCGTWNKRFITDKAKDPFWRLSPTIKQDRSKHYKDMIQPSETGFSMLYGSK